MQCLKIHVLQYGLKVNVVSRFLARDKEGAKFVTQVMW
jgi:hypothetical protein